MDQADKMKLTKYGFNLKVLGVSSFLSVLGIIVSIIGVTGSIACFVLGSIATRPMIVFYITGAVILIIMIPYLIMWILLKIKTNKKDIPGIEKIGKVYSYVSGSLEIIAMMIRIIFSALALLVLLYQEGYDQGDYYYLPIAIQIVFLIGSALYLVFACLKIHGVRVENNKLVGTYLGFRYGLFALSIISGIIIISISGGFYYNIFVVVIMFVVVGIHFILDIGLTVILHSIRVNRENTAGTETAMKC